MSATLSAWSMAVLAASTVRLGLPPPRQLSVRLRPYAGLLRSRLGTGYADLSIIRATESEPASTLLRIFGPSLRHAAQRFASLVDAGPDEQLSLRLRQAGFGDVDPVQHRIRQLAWGVSGVLLGGLVGAVLLKSLFGTLFMMLCLGFPAATLQRGRVERAISARRALMRTEVYTVAQLLAVHLRTGHGPVEAVRALCDRGRGPVVGELRDALSWISSGVTPAKSYQRLAETTAEPTAARLYRLLAASAQSGSDVSRALLAVADDVRAERRDELARRAVRQRTAMLVPLLLLIAPVMILFVGAAIPSMVLGFRS